MKQTSHPTLTMNGECFVLVPVSEYRKRLRSAAADPGPSKAAINEAAAVMQDPTMEWFDVDLLYSELVRRGLASVRAVLRVTQFQLAEALSVSQAQISRWERNPGSLSAATIQRVANVVGEMFGERHAQETRHASPKPGAIKDSASRLSRSHSSRSSQSNRRGR